MVLGLEAAQCDLVEGSTNEADANLLEGRDSLG